MHSNASDKNSDRSENIDHAQDSSSNFHCSNGDTCRLAEEIQRLQEELASMSELVSIDSLTGLYNYHHFKTAINQEFERTQRTKHATALLMIDVDYFKTVNDKWGHDIGNQALELIANCIRHNIRKLDIACRYGGEEFAVLLPSTDLNTAIAVAERIRKSVEAAVFIVGEEEQKEQQPLSISLGISLNLGHKNDDWQKMVKRADRNLYNAKRSGRNQVSYQVEQIEEPGRVNPEEKDALLGLLNIDESKKSDISRKGR